MSTKKIVIGILLLAFFSVFGIPLIAFGIFLLTYSYIGRPYQIAGKAMAPNYTDGQYYMTSVIRGNTTLERGDVVVFTPPTKKDVNFIKRIVGLPGERVIVKEKKVFINDKELDESQYTFEDTYGGNFLKEGQELLLKENEYFLLGDNRPFSSDSREWGPVAKDYFISKVAFCYYRCAK